MYPKIDYSDLENIEPVPGGKWEGCKIVAHYRSDATPRCDGGVYAHLVIVELPDGCCEPHILTEDGCAVHGKPPVIRNKPKRVTLQECWVIYMPDGQYSRTVFSEEAAEWLAGKGLIVRHIPAEEREV